MHSITPIGEGEEAIAFLHEFVAAGTLCTQGRTKLPTGNSLQYYRFAPAVESSLPKLVLIPGLVSVMETFRPVLVGLSRYFEIIYLETPEKRSAEMHSGYSYSIEAMSEDLAAFINEHNFEEEGYLLLGYSLGATLVMQAAAMLVKTPRAIVAAEPAAAFSFPWWALLLTHIAAPVYPSLLPGILWYIRHFRANRYEDEEMPRIVERALNSADAGRLCKTIRAIAPYQVWPALGTIHCPVLLLGTSLDTFHPYRETLELAARIPHAKLVDLQTNLRSHSSEVAEVILEYLGEQDQLVESAHSAMA